MNNTETEQKPNVSPVNEESIPQVEMDEQGLPKNRNYGDLEIIRNNVALTYKLRPRIRKEYKGKPAPPLNMPEVTEETYPMLVEHYGMKMILAWLEDAIRTENQVLGEDFYSPDLSKRDSEGYAKVLTEFTMERETKSGLQALADSLMEQYKKAMRENDKATLDSVGKQIVETQMRIMNLRRNKSAQE